MVTSVVSFFMLEVTKPQPDKKAKEAAKAAEEKATVEKTPPETGRQGNIIWTHLIPSAHFVTNDMLYSH